MARHNLEESYLFRTILDEYDVYTNVVEHFQPWEASTDPMRGTMAYQSTIPSNRSLGVDRGNLDPGPDKGSELDTRVEMQGIRTYRSSVPSPS